MTGPDAANAFRAWISSDGASSKNPDTLGTGKRRAEYLENRLRQAFLAGVKAAEGVAEFELRERLETMFFGVRR